MSSLLIAGAYAGLASGSILTFLSHVAPRFGAGNFIQDTDNLEALGRKLSRREAHLLGVLVHLVLTLIYGVVFAYAVSRGWTEFALLPVLGYSVILVLIAGLIVMPLEGQGWFGVKHDSWFVVDAFLTSFGWGLLYLWLIRLWIGG